MMKAKRKFLPLQSERVCQIYEYLQNKGHIAFPLTLAAQQKASAIVATVTEPYFGKEIYESVEEKIVAYLYFLIKDHPFIDGNKRTASLVFSILCRQNEIYPQLGRGNPKLDDLAVYVQEIAEADHQGAIQQVADMLFKD